MGANLINQGLEDLTREFPDIDGTTKEIVYALYFLTRSFSRTAGRILEGYEITWGEYQVLSTLRRRGTNVKMSPSALCDSTGMSTGGLSNLLRHMESLGLVKRAASPRDGRGVMVSITPKGRRIAEEAMKAISADQETHIGVLDAAQRDALLSNLRALVAHYEAVGLARAL